MQSHCAAPTPEVSPWASTTMLEITLSQLREWETQAARHLIIVPKADEQAWEDTEIDVRRTAL